MSARRVLMIALLVAVLRYLLRRTPRSSTPTRRRRAAPPPGAPSQEDRRTAAQRPRNRSTAPASVWSPPTYVPPGVNAKGVYTTPVTPASKNATSTYNLDWTIGVNGKSGCLVCHGDTNLRRVERASRQPLRRHGRAGGLCARQVAVHRLSRRLRLQDPAPGHPSGRELAHRRQELLRAGPATRRSSSSGPRARTRLPGSTSATSQRRTRDVVCARHASAAVRRLPLRALHPGQERHGGKRGSSRHRRSRCAADATLRRRRPTTTTTTVPPIVEAPRMLLRAGSATTLTWCFRPPTGSRRRTQTTWWVRARSATRAPSEGYVEIRDARPHADRPSFTRTR